MEEYRCIKGFSLILRDDNGLQIEDYKTVDVGEIWRTPEEENYRFISGEVRLESDELGRFGIPENMLEEYFEKIS